MTDATMASGAPGAPDKPVVFAGARGELVRIVVVNALLTLVTLGIYRFWAKTAIREYYWQNTVLGGDAFEYTGRGVELFLGFLIAMVVLAIGSTVVGVVQFYVGLQDPAAAQAINLVVYVGIAWLLGYAVYRARRYRLTRTLWRGIRFGQDGSPARYAWLRFGWLLLLIVTLGAVRPWYEVALRRYEMAHTRFGFTRFDYAGKGRELMRYWWPALVALILLIAGGLYVAGKLFIAVGTKLAERAEYGASAEWKQQFDADPVVGLVILALPLVGLVFVLLDVRYRIAALRYLFEVTSLNGVAARSRVRMPRVVLYALTAYGLVFLLLAVLALLMPWLGGFGVFLFIVAILSMGPIVQLLFIYPLVRHVATTLVTTDLAALDDVVQATRDDPRFGEGLLDALDFDMGVV